MTTTPMEEPNGQRISGAELYRALYGVRGELMEQFGLLSDRLSSVDDRCQAIDARAATLEGRVSEHVNNHPPAKASLAQVGGIAGIIATVATAMVTAIYGLIKRGL